MVSIGGSFWSPFATLKATSSTAKSSTATSSTASEGPVSRTASSTGSAKAVESNPGVRDANAGNAIKIDLPKGERTADEVRLQMRKQLDDVFRAFYKDENQRHRATNEAMRSLAPRIEEAAGSKDVTQIQLRVASVEKRHVDAVFGGSVANVRAPGLDVGMVRNGKVAAADTTVLTTEGKAVNLSASEIAQGIKSGAYVTNETLPAPSGKAADDLRKAQAGLARIRMTQEALSAYRAGNFGPLDDLRRSMQGEMSRVQSDPAAGLTSRNPLERKFALYRMAMNPFRGF